MTTTTTITNGTVPRSRTQDSGVYRFSLHSPAEGDSVYIGEGMLLRKRFDWYRVGHKSQVTNHRMNNRIKTVIAAGGSVQIDVATEIVLEVGGNTTPSNLHNAFQRKLAENAALVAAEQASEKIENSWKES